MKKKECISRLLSRKGQLPEKQIGEGRAPMNIALVKYWGKRDRELNLPVTSSLSLSIALYTSTRIEWQKGGSIQDRVVLDGKEVAQTSQFYKRMVSFLDLIRPTKELSFHVTTANEMPTAAGLASSASGFAALVLALNDLFMWEKHETALSILARLGSGSACRSLYPGFVLWQRGQEADGMDSYGIPLVETWPSLKMAYVPVSSDEKPLSSTLAMQRTVETSPLYSVWPESTSLHIQKAQQAICKRDFAELGAVVESSALMMHATMLAAHDPILYWLPKSVEVLHRVWKARKEGFHVYLTMDAGPNVKLLFQEKEQALLHTYFPEARTMSPLWAP